MQTALTVTSVYYIGVNLILFFMMGYDKKMAEGEKWRVAEHTLFLLGLLGGAIGGLGGMHIFHHKTRKPVFYFIFIFSVILHIAFVYFLYSVFFRHLQW